MEQVEIIPESGSLVILASTESIPFGSAEDIGRRVLHNAIMLSGAKQLSGTASMGIIVGYKEMVETRYAQGAVVEGEIGDEIDKLHRAKQDECWTIAYGNGLVVDVGVAEVTQGLQLYHNALQTEAFRAQTGITIDTLNSEVNAIIKDKAIRAKLTNKAKSSPTKASAKPIAMIGEPSAVEGVGNEANAVPLMQCAVCQKMFKSALGLKYHMKNVCVVGDSFVEEANGNQSAAVAAVASIAVSGKRKRKVVNYAEANGEDRPISTPTSAAASGRGGTAAARARRRRVEEEDEEYDDLKENDNDSDNENINDDNEYVSEDGTSTTKRRAAGRDSSSSATPGRKRKSFFNKKPIATEYFSSIEADPNVKRYYNSSKSRLQSEGVFHLATSFKGKSCSDSNVIQSIFDSLRDNSSCECTFLQNWIDCQNESLAKKDLSIRLPTEAVTIMSDPDANASVDGPALKPFQSQANESSSSSSTDKDSGKREAEWMDLFINAAGPVWGLSLSPTGTALSSSSSSSSLSSADSVRYLAVGTSRIGWLSPDSSDSSSGSGSNKQSIGLSSGIGSDELLILGRATSHPNIVQIWQIPSDTNVAIAGTAAATPVCCIGLPSRGTCNKLSWCPYAPSVQENSSSTVANKSIIGLLAVVCGDGSALVLAVPGISSDGTISDIGDRCGATAADITTYDESSLHSYVISIPGKMIMSLCWNPHAPHQLLCGMSDGSISLWSLPMPLQQQRQQHLSHPDLIFLDSSVQRGHPCLAAVATVAWCPYHPHIFGAAGYDSVIRIWSVHNSFRPLYCRKCVNGWILDLKWDPCGLGLILSCSDSTTVYHDILWGNAAKPRTGLYSHVDPYGCTWSSEALCIDDHSAVVSVASDGTVRFGFVDTLINKRAPVEPIQLYQQLQLRVAEAEREGNILSLSTEIASADETLSSKANNNQNKSIFDVTLLTQPDRRGLSLQALAAATMPSSNTLSSSSSSPSSSPPERALLAYGGATGIIRVHSIDLVKQFCVHFKM